MIEVERLDEMPSYVGRELGVSAWLDVDQDRIDLFARATGDDQWIHVDAERARRELDGGRTVAHGNFSLALIAPLSWSIYSLKERARSVNAGYNKVRFIHPIHVGDRVRLRLALRATEWVAGGLRLVMGATIEIDGCARPAVVAEAISIAYR
ncbi:MaoC family dehydratase [Corallococcus sp. 4LFB]|uniref:MaoC family dehydratase n=1 Tax=Corallococcus sp. 4LFB TaxID=3383249 RepID=UPI0039758AD3